MCIKNCKCLISIALSAIFSVIIGAFFFLAEIPGLAVALWVVFGFSVLTLILISITLLFGNISKCLCKLSKCLLISSITSLVLSIGTLISSLILAVGCVPSAIFVGIIAFFFGLNLISFIQLICCTIDKNCNC